MSWLVDGNAIIALVIKSHPHHARAKAWFEALTEIFHTCSVTEGTFLRLHMMLAIDTTAAAAWKNLALISQTRCMCSSTTVTATHKSPRVCSKGTNRSRMHGSHNSPADTTFASPRWMEDWWRRILMLGS